MKQLTHVFRGIASFLTQSLRDVVFAGCQLAAAASVLNFRSTYPLHIRL
jgi:hypothetical protein